MVSPPSAHCLGPDSIAALFDGELDAAARSSAEAHLDRCEPCRELLAHLASGVLEAAGAPTRREGGSDSCWTTIPQHRAPGEPRYAAGDRMGPFVIAGLLGRGGMGEVYLAEDPRLGRRVALKVVGESQLETPRSVDRFLREARMTARLNHPSIVTIHDVGEHGGRPYLALEYVEGSTLRQWAREHRAQGWRPVASIGLAIAEALAAAHGAGVLHRDLKPENVLVGLDGRVRVVDFGLAAPIDSVLPGTDSQVACSVTTVAGTPRYMAPEQWRGDVITGAADVWALAIILYELCTDGAHPWGDSEPAVAVALEAPMSSLPSSAAPLELRRLCERCLALDPSARPSAAEVASVLGRLLQEKTPRRWARAASWTAVLLALTASALVAHAWSAPTLPRETVAKTEPPPAPAPERPKEAARAAAPRTEAPTPKLPPRASPTPQRRPAAAGNDDWLRSWD
jgi:serine/threonine-protein kinase